MADRISPAMTTPRRGRGTVYRLDAFEKPTEILCGHPRACCKGFAKVRKAPSPWEGKSKPSTREFEAFSLTLMREMPVKQADEVFWGRAIPGCGDCMRAHAKCKRWQESLAPLAWAVRSTRVNLEGILAHWNGEWSAALLEESNIWFSAVKRRARGYHCSCPIITMLPLVGGQAQTPIISMPRKLARKRKIPDAQVVGIDERIAVQESQYGVT